MSSGPQARSKPSLAASRRRRPAWIRDARTYPFVNAASEEMVQLIEMRRELLRDDEAATSEEG